MLNRQHCREKAKQNQVEGKQLHYTYSNIYIYISNLNHWKMSSIAQQSLEQIIAPGNKASNTGKRAHNNSKTIRGAGGKAISFQRRGKPFPAARGASVAAKNRSLLPAAAGRKAARIHSLKATKLAAKSISQNHRDQIVQQYLKQQQAGNQLVSKKVSVSGLPADVNESSIRVCFL